MVAHSNSLVWEISWAEKPVSSVAQSYLTICDPVDCSTPGFPVHHKLPELAQTHVHRVSDAIQPFHAKRLSHGYSPWGY